MRYRLIDKITNNRKEFFEVVVVTIVLAISASGIASALFEIFDQSDIHLLSIFIIVILFCLLFLARKLVSTRKYKLIIQAFLIFDKKENELVFIPRYHYGEKLFRYLNGAFKENSALLSQWRKEPIGSGLEFDIKKGTVTIRKTASVKFIKEATEYYILDTLSTHLKDYFNKEHYSKSELREYSREDVPDILLSNRFMELFTSPMENRSSFNHEYLGDRQGTIISSSGKDGAIYHRFDLILPNRTAVSRDSSGAIKFDSKNFVLKYNVDFEEFGFVTPFGFERHYLGIMDYENSSGYSLIVEFEVNFKLLSLLRNSKWDYHAWLDGFLETIDKKMSAEAFFDQIKWDVAYTIIQCGEVSKGSIN